MSTEIIVTFVDCMEKNINELGTYIIPDLAKIINLYIPKPINMCPLCTALYDYRYSCDKCSNYYCKKCVPYKYNKTKCKSMGCIACVSVFYLDRIYCPPCCDKETIEREIKIWLYLSIYWLS
jgi:hypothetical protein